MKAAERYQDRLYDKYENVKLVEVPGEFDGEEGGGLYVWEVSGDSKPFTAEELEKLTQMAGLGRLGHRPVVNDRRRGRRAYRT